MSNPRIIRALELIHDATEYREIPLVALGLLGEAQLELEAHIAETQAKERRQKLCLLPRVGK